MRIIHAECSAQLLTHTNSSLATYHFLICIFDRDATGSYRLYTVPGSISRVDLCMYNDILTNANKSNILGKGIFSSFSQRCGMY